MQRLSAGPHVPVSGRASLTSLPVSTALGLGSSAGRDHPAHSSVGQCSRELTPSWEEP